MLDWGKATTDLFNEKLKQAICVFNVAFKSDIDRKRAMEYVYCRILWNFKNLPKDVDQVALLDLRGQHVSFKKQDEWRTVLIESLSDKKINVSIRFKVD